MSKLKSRKFFVFLVWCIFAGLVIWQVKDAETTKVLIPWFGGISAIYIGAQAFVDFILALMPIIQPYLDQWFKNKFGGE